MKKIAVLTLVLGSFLFTSTNAQQRNSVSRKKAKPVFYFTTVITMNKEIKECVLSRIMNDSAFFFPLSNEPGRPYILPANEFGLAAENIKRISIKPDKSISLPKEMKNTDSTLPGFKHIQGSDEMAKPLMSEFFFPASDFFVFDMSNGFAFGAPLAFGAFLMLDLIIASSGEPFKINGEKEKLRGMAIELINRHNLNPVAGSEDKNSTSNEK